MSLAEDSRTNKKILLLEAVIGWLEHKISGFTDSKLLLTTIEKTAEQICTIKNPALRDSLFTYLEKLVGQINPAAEQASQSEDSIMMSIVIALMFSGAKESGIGTQYAAKAILGAALTRCGEDFRGSALLEEAVEKTDTLTTSSFVFASITKALLKLPEKKQAVSLFERLIRKLGDAEQIQRLRDMLEAIAAGKNSNAGAFLDSVVPIIKVLDFKKRSVMLEHLARAAFYCGKTELARQHAPALTGIQFFVLSRSPFISTEGRIRIISQQIGAKHFAGFSDAAWQRKWLRKYARLLQGLESEKTKAKELKNYAELCAEVKNPEAFGDAFGVIENFISEEYRSEALQTILENAETFDQETCRQLRKKVFFMAGKIKSESLRYGVLTKWLAGLRSEELTDALNTSAESIQAPSVRADFYAELAGALLGLGKAEKAQQFWQTAALSDQEDLSRSMIFETRMAACARSGDEADWNEVLQAAHCPDLEIAARAVISAAKACDDPAKLELLEKVIRRHNWYWAVKSDLARMHFAVARAFARIGDARRGAKIALECLKKTRVDLETARWFVEDRLGLILLLKMIPNSGGSKNLAEIFAAIPEETWQQEAFRQLFISASETDSSLSKWDRTAAVADVARGLALCGQKKIAVNLIRREIKLLPKEKTNILRPQGEAAAFLALGRAMTAAGMPEANRYLNSAIDSASKMKGGSFKSDAFAIALDAWKELQFSSAAERFQIESLAHQTVEEIPEGMGGKYKPLVSLALQFAELGMMEKASLIAGQIENQEAREDALVGLIKEAALLSEKLQIWKQISGANGRNRAAKELAAAYFQLGPPHALKTSAAEWTISFRQSKLAQMLFTILLFLIVVIGSYSAFWMLYPDMPLFILSLSIAVVFSFKPIRKEVETLVRKRRLRFPAILLGLLLAPFLWGANLSLLFTDKIVPRLRLWKFLWLKRPPDPPAPAPVVRQMPPHFSDYFQFLRLAVNESSTFDKLLAPLLYLKNEQAEIRRILDALPDPQFPPEPPASLRQNMADYEEAKRAGRLHIRLKKWLKKFAVKAGVVFTVIFVFPVSAIQGIFLERQYQKGRKLAVKGSELIKEGKSKEALPYLQRALKLSPDIPQFWSDYAIALSENNQLDEAVKAYREAIRLGTGSAQEFVFWYNLAYNLLYGGRYEEALECFERVVEIAPRDDEFYQNAINGCSFCRTNMSFMSFGR